MQTTPSYIPFVRSGNTISLFFDDKQHIVDNTHPNFSKILDALKSRDFEPIPDLVSIVNAVTKWGSNLIRIEHGEVFYKDLKVTNYQTQVILQMMEEGLPVDPLVRNLEKLMSNPSYRVREQYYRFIESAKMPICEDGDFFAWKSVREDYYDQWTGKTHCYKPGSIVEMPRESVDDDPTRTCSAGLHVCSEDYGHFSKRLMLVKVSPADVVSVPVEYKDAKMRVCRMEVVKEILSREFQRYESSVLDTSGDLISEYNRGYDDGYSNARFDYE